MLPKGNSRVTGHVGLTPPKHFSFSPSVLELCAEIFCNGRHTITIRHRTLIMEKTGHLSVNRRMTALQCAVGSLMILIFWEAAKKTPATPCRTGETTAECSYNVRPFQSSWYAGENHTTGNRRYWSSQRKTAYIMPEQRQGIDRPVTVMVDAHWNRQNALGNYQSRGVCCSTPSP